MDCPTGSAADVAAGSAAGTALLRTGLTHCLQAVTLDDGIDGQPALLRLSSKRKLGRGEGQPAPGTPPASSARRRLRTRPHSRSPPRLPKHEGRAEQPLVRAIRSGSVAEVRAVLDANPESMEDAFFERSFEPALCVAVRAGCKVEIIRLLLRHGADVSARDVRGYTALTALCTLPGGDAEPVEDNDDDVCMPFLLPPPGWGAPRACAEVTARTLAAARALVHGGASLRERDGQDRLPARVAEKHGHRALALLCGFDLEAQACLALSRAPQVCRLPPHAILAVQGCLMPEGALLRLLQLATRHAPEGVP